MRVSGWKPPWIFSRWTWSKSIVTFIWKELHSGLWVWLQTISDSEYSNSKINKAIKRARISWGRKTATSSVDVSCQSNFSKGQRKHKNHTRDLPYKYNRKREGCWSLALEIKVVPHRPSDFVVDNQSWLYPVVWRGWGWWRQLGMGVEDQLNVTGVESLRRCFGAGENERDLVSRSTLGRMVEYVWLGDLLRKSENMLSTMVPLWYQRFLSASCRFMRRQCLWRSVQDKPSGHELLSTLSNQTRSLNSCMKYFKTRTVRSGGLEASLALPRDQWTSPNRPKVLVPLCYPYHAPGDELVFVHQLVSKSWQNEQTMERVTKDLDDFPYVAKRLWRGHPTPRKTSWSCWNIQKLQ